MTSTKTSRHIVGIIFIASFIVFIILMIAIAQARDPDGHYAQSQYNQWFNSLYSRGGGNCCSTSDGMRLDDPDWGIDGEGYWVTLNNEKIRVTDDFLVTVPNKVGVAIVWPYMNPDGTLMLTDGKAKVRCFMPGAVS